MHILSVLFFATTILHHPFADTLDYYSKVICAEEEIINDDYSTALKVYTEAFDLSENPIDKDLYNAMVCAIYADQDSMAIVLAKRLVGYGHLLKYFNFRTEKSKIFEQSESWKTFQAEYPQRRVQYEQSIDSVLWHEINEIFEEDQKLARTVPIRRDMDSLVYENTKKLCAIFSKHPIPVELAFSTQINLLFTHYYGLINDIKYGNLYTKSPYKSMDLLKYNLNSIIYSAVLEQRWSPMKYRESLHHSHYPEESLFEYQDKYRIITDFDRDTFYIEQGSPEMYEKSEQIRRDCKMPSYVHEEKLMKKFSNFASFPFDAMKKEMERLKNDSVFQNLPNRDKPIVYQGKKAEIFHNWSRNFGGASDFMFGARVSLSISDKYERMLFENRFSNKK